MTGTGAAGTGGEAAVGGEAAGTGGEGTGALGAGEAAGASGGEATGGEVAADSGASSSSPVVWSGELAQLKSSDWFAGLEKSVQDRLLAGIEAKYQNYEKRYKPAYEAQAARQRELDTLAARLADDERRVLRLWTGEESPKVADPAELEKLKADHEARVAAIIEAHRAELDGAKKPSPELEAKLAKLEAQEAKLAKLEKDNEGLAARLSAQEAAEQEAALGAFESWLQADAPHLIGNDADSAGFDSLINLISSGTTPDKALRMVLAEYPAPAAAPKPDEVPKSVAAMGHGNNGATKAKDTRSLSEAWNEMQRQAQQTWRGSDAG